MEVVFKIIVTLDGDEFFAHVDTDPNKEGKGTSPKEAIKDLVKQIDESFEG